MEVLKNTGCNTP